MKVYQFELSQPFNLVIKIITHCAIIISRHDLRQGYGQSENIHYIIIISQLKICASMLT